MPDFDDRGFLPDDSGRTEDTMRRLQEVASRLAEIDGVGEASDGLVRAVVEAGGRVKRVMFDPKVRRLDDETLADEVVMAVLAAQADAERQAQELLSEALDGTTRPPADFGFERAIEQIQQIEDSFNRSMDGYAQELERIRRQFE